jgi:hypothetical protein
MIYVVAHDGGCEGHSLPFLAFNDRETALKWVQGQAECFSVAEVPVYPELPATTWFNVVTIRAV